MRRLLVLGALALSCSIASLASADVRHAPPHLEFVGDPEAAVAGRTMTGTLRVVSSGPAEISNLRFDGAGWTARSTDAPARARLSAASPLTFTFTATPTNPKQPLIVRYEVDGVSYEESIDFSPEALERALRPGNTRRMAQREVTPFPGDPASKARPATIAARAPSALRGKADQPMKDTEEPARIAARNIRVHGRFVYDRSDGPTIGADGVAVRIYDEDTGFDEQLASTVTDANGYYDVTFNWDPCFVCDGQPDIYVEFETANSKVNVRTTGVFGGNYVWDSGTTNDYGGTNLDEGWQAPSDEGQHPALHLITDITRDWRWYLNYEGYDQSHISVYWPDGASGAYYDDGDPGIHVGDDRRWREDTHAHEYGHHWIYTHAVGQTPDYCNGVCDSPTCGHCLWCAETNHDAWNEGWPNWVCNVQTNSYAGDYGLASQFTRDQENVQTCSGTLNDPTTTEGFIGALLQDIWDSNNEDDGGAPGTWRDRLSLGFDEIFTVSDLDNAVNPLDFITKFKNRFPAQKELLWETAKNCTYEVDATNPSNVTSLTSPSHTVSVSSPDPTVDFTWTRANDDWSGVDGYSIVVAATAQLPNTTIDINNVTAYTTPTLAPGTYYFSIRSHDRSGKWAASYASFGPVIIRAPEPANLTSHLFGGWAHETVPRGAADGTFGSVPNPTSPLPGNSNSTYWNLGGINDGESSTSTGFYSRCYVDDVFKTSFFWNPVGPGGGFYGNNGGPFTVTGGRHTFETRYDALDAIAETNESDNAWGHQWIWAPLLLASGTQYTRSAPPVRDAGWSSIVDGSVLWFDCDGLRMNSTANGQYWHGIYVYATDNDDDYDARLHFATSSADTGFSTNRGFSARSAGQLDAVLVNRNTVSTPTLWDVGILNSNSGVSTYNTRQVSSQILSFGDSLLLPMAATEMMMLREFFIGSGNLGDVSITARIVSGTGPVHLAWLDRTFTTGDLLDATATATAVGAATARIDVNVATTGWNGIALYRDPENGTAAVTVVLEISKTPPDFLPLFAAGWHAPFVPRPANDGTPASVPLPDTLRGNADATYLNFAVRNDSPTGASGLLGQVYLDGIYTWYLAYGAFPGNANSLFNWNAAWNVRGGRHTLSVNYDQIQAIEEKFEDNNIYGEQFVWSPLPLSLATAVTRSNPPDRTGGWTDIRSGEPLWFNCDGLRTPLFAPSGANGFWGAVAVMPVAGTDVDVRLHELQPGAKDGFAANLGVSAWGPSQSDFSIVNFNATGFRRFEAGVMRSAAGGNYTAEAVNSIYRGTNPTTVIGPFTLAGGHILHLHEVYLAAGSYSVYLDNLTGTVDWGVSLQPTGTAFQTKSGALGSAWFNGPAADEQFTVVVPTAGFHCLAVWKVGSNDLNQSGTYEFQIRNLTVDAPGGTTGRTAMSRVYPNPFSPRTTIDFELARESETDVVVYDVHGARVRTLAHGRWPAGQHQVAWTGDDDNGRALSPGIYMVRFAADGQSAMRKLIKLD